jgi:hypothetical protein
MATGTFAGNMQMGSTGQFMWYMCKKSEIQKSTHSIIHKKVTCKEELLGSVPIVLFGAQVNIEHTIIIAQSGN